MKDASLGAGSIAVVLDVDGVVSPLDGVSEWGDDVTAGFLFGTVRVSPTLCSRLDQFGGCSIVECWWLTSWTASMRLEMHPFPGREWPALADPKDPDVYRGKPSLLFEGEPWWKWEAIDRWLATGGAPAGLIWCDDHLSGPDNTWLLHDLVKEELDGRGVPSLLVVPQRALGLTPSHLDQITAWVQDRTQSRSSK